jgi:hypothetical protein
MDDERDDGLDDGLDDEDREDRERADLAEARGDEILAVEFQGEVWQWRGPAPYYFITVPEEPASLLRALSAMVTYGWGMIPVRVSIGRSTWQTALWPKDGRYVVPIKKVVRLGERLDEGQIVGVRLAVGE